MYKSLMQRSAAYLLCIVGFSACFGETDTTIEQASNLKKSEGMIDAFYSFDPIRLKPFLQKSGEAEAEILAYQAWAEGGNYFVLARFPCMNKSANTISCSITVQDDPVVALETGFNVTDTFLLTFEDGVIKGVETSSDDQPIYFEAGEWVKANLPKVMEGPCKRKDGIRITPGDCAKAMTDGYKLFMQAKKSAASSIL